MCIRKKSQYNAVTHLSDLHTVETVFFYTFIGIVRQDRPVDGVAIALSRDVRRRRPCTRTHSRSGRRTGVTGSAAARGWRPAVAGQLVGLVGGRGERGWRRLAVGCGRRRRLLSEVRSRRMQHHGATRRRAVHVVLSETGDDARVHRRVGRSHRQFRLILYTVASDN